MRRAWVWVGACLFLLGTQHAAWAQSSQQTTAAEDIAQFKELFTKREQIKDLEQTIALLEQLVGLDAKLIEWPFVDVQRSGAMHAIRTALGRAYLARSTPDRADNVERAIGHYEKALAIRNKEDDPEACACTESALAGAYMDRILGERPDNIEKAISLYESALSRLTKESFPENWANVQIGIGQAYTSRVRGERATNIERALAHLEAASSVKALEASPSWGVLKGALGNAYLARVVGNSADNIEWAIAAYDAALRALTQTKAPSGWATTQVSLARAYRARKVGERSDNLAKAIASYEAAGKVFTRESFPRQWAVLEVELGDFYACDCMTGDRSANIEKGIAHYQNAMNVVRDQLGPHAWAALNQSLAVAYRVRREGSRVDNLQVAIDKYLSALAVFTTDVFPRDHLVIARELGSALLQNSDWSGASVIYDSARQAFLRLFGEGLDDAEARSLIQLAGQIFSEAAYAAVKRGGDGTAFALLNEGMARQLSVALRQHELDLPIEKRPKLSALNAEIREWSRLLTDAKGPDAIQAISRITQLRQELGALIAPASKRTPADRLVIDHALIPEGGAIIAPVITQLGAKLLIAETTRGTVTFSSADLPIHVGSVDRLLRGSNGGSVGSDGGWLGAYRIQYLPPDGQRRHFPQWLAAIDNLGPQLWTLIGQTADAALKARGVKEGARIVWLPTEGLGLLPVGLAQDPASGLRLGDFYEIVYAPSIEALAVASRQAARPSVASLALAVNPTDDLAFTEIEGAFIASKFEARSVLKLDKYSASVDTVIAALKGKSYWHFASHGQFDWSDVRKSGLVMRDGEVLTVGHLVGLQQTLGRPRLVTLSACETGLYDTSSSSPNEFIGLPATFMQIGAAGVVGSLWLVPDDATALMMAKFYELQMNKSLAPPTALKEAQLWLRSASRAQLISYVQQITAQAKLGAPKPAELEQALTNGQRSYASRFGALWDSINEELQSSTDATRASKQSAAQSRPFQHPYYWGGFVYTGL